jgi:fatty acid desaturase (delta-4 desaturase)
MYLVAGYYLAFFFSISHNFKGVHMLDETTRASNQGDKKNSYLYKQVTSSSNVGGWWLAHLNGGLNYQIEHHLFPRISHMHYPTVAPVVRYVLFVKEWVI